MTVAAVLIAATPASALADAAGQPAIRRLADLAWSGGALPIVGVGPDPDGAVRAALAGSEATFAEAGTTDRPGPAALLLLGFERAEADVSGTTAALAWPAPMAWVGPETVTSLIEAHGTTPDAILRPTFRGEPGWPVLVPATAAAELRAIAASATLAQTVADLAAAGREIRDLALGDPGTVHDMATARADLPAYEGPDQPASGHVHEWGADVATDADDLADEAGIAGLAADEGAPPRA